MTAYRRKNKKELVSGIEKPFSSVKLIACATLHIKYEDGTEAIRYHDTDVVTFLQNGNFVLNSGGHRTKTTKSRILEHSHIRISQENFIWYIYENDKKIEFYDGMIFNSDKHFISKEKSSDKKKISILKSKIKNYVDLLNKGIPKPSFGDCLICANNKQSCLTSHLNENYIHGTLLVNALKAEGRNDINIQRIFQLNIKSIFKKALTKYLTKYLITPLILKVK